MTQDTRAMPGPGKQTKQKNPPTKEDDITEADEDLEIPEANVIFDKIQRFLEKFACNSLGQMVYEKCDRALKVVEETARWSLPQDDNDAKLERPLPWVLFLSLIISLRFMYLTLNIGATIMGTERVTPRSLIYAIQIKRRRLRVIRVRGLKAIRRLEEDSSATSGSSGKPTSLIVKVRQLFGSAFCRPGQIRDVPGRRVFAQGDNANKELNDKSTDRCTTKRARDDDSAADLNLTVDQLLNKYANDDSEDDSDYVPNVEDDDTGSASSSSMSSDEETVSAEISKNTSKNSDSLDQSVIENKANGGPIHRPMETPLAEFKQEPIPDADSANEPINTPREPESSGKLDDIHSGQQATEVAPKGSQEQLNTPTTTTTTTQHELNVTLDEGAQKKSTPGHETAASLKTISGAKKPAEPSTEPSKSNPKDIPTSRRTITTQTCIEYDWTIVMKTEITYRRQPVQSVKVDCSVQTLTPASSTEDIFYSPIGSPQDFHSIFHPAPLIKVHPVEDHSTPKERTDGSGSSAPATPDWNQPHQRKANYNKQNNYNNKNRNKNRR